MIVSVEELTVTCVLFSWIIFAVGFLTKKLYEAMEAKGFKHNVAVYYNRKLIHMSTGGLVALVTPFVFKTPLLPLVFASLLAVLTYIPHKTGKLMYWFQTEENMYEVSFCIMWGATVTFGWFVSGGNFWFGVLPVLFMSFGDGITGVVRNAMFKRRTKSWWGNLVMALFSILIGTTLGLPGVLAGCVASLVEHFEFPPIDDNVTVPLSSFIVLILAKFCVPWL